MKTGFDFVALHDAYAPFAHDRSYSERDLYLATVAASSQTANDFEATRASLARYIRRRVPLAITEFAPLFTIGKNADDYIGTITGALYVADLFRVFATSGDVLMAAYWSLSGNWEFGALSQKGERRPAYLVLEAYSKFLKGQVISTAVNAPSFESPRVGFTAARSGLPLITVLALRDRKTLTFFVINKDIEKSAEMSLAIHSVNHLETASMRQLTAAAPFARARTGATFSWMDAPITIRSKNLHASLLPHSINILTVTYQ
jgi:alpha-L-arabinofuranosidase